MANYHLMRTIVPLSGQCEWAIDINTEGVENFHLRPISDYINYVEDRNWLLYDHHNNLKHLYEKTSDTFFKSIINPKLEIGHPEITDKQEITFDSTYTYGVERISYSKYGKTMKLFVPLWLDDLSNIKSLNFEIIGKPARNYRFGDTGNENTNKYDDVWFNNNAIDTEKNIIDFNITFDKDDSNNTVNGKLSRYFWQYVSDVNKTEYDEFLYLSFANKRAVISGVDVRSGEYMTKDVTTVLINNLSSRERPVMEQNNIITSQWSKNYLIAKQLYNFAFYFDVENLFAGNNCSFAPLNFICSVSVIDTDGVKTVLDKADFLYNYDFLPKKKISFDYNEMTDVLGNSYNIAANRITGDPIYSTNITEENIYDYLSDDKYIDIIKKNKLVAEDIFFKSQVQKNPFSLYDGFAPIYDTKDAETVKSTAILGEDTNPADKDWTKVNNASLWAKWTFACEEQQDPYFDLNFANFSEKIEPSKQKRNKFNWNGITFLYDEDAASKIEGSRICGILLKSFLQINNSEINDENEFLFKKINPDDGNTYILPYNIRKINNDIGVMAFAGCSSPLNIDIKSTKAIMDKTTFASLKEYIKCININGSSLSDNFILNMELQNFNSRKLTKNTSSSGIYNAWTIKSKDVLQKYPELFNYDVKVSTEQTGSVNYNAPKYIGTETGYIYFQYSVLKSEWDWTTSQGKQISPINWIPIANNSKRDSKYIDTNYDCSGKDDWGVRILFNKYFASKEEGDYITYWGVCRLVNGDYNVLVRTYQPYQGYVLGVNTESSKYGFNNTEFNNSKIDFNIVHPYAKILTKAEARKYGVIQENDKWIPESPILSFADFEEDINNYTNLATKQLVPVLKLSINGNGNIDVDKAKISLSYCIDALNYSDSEAITALQGLLDNYVPETVVFFDKTIVPTQAKGPDGSTEIKYNKSDSYYKYLLRYDGVMEPFFITETNNDSAYYNKHYEVSKITKSDFLNSTFYRYMQTDYTSVYPSVGYWGLSSCDVKFGGDENIFNPSIYKQNRFNDNVCFYNYYPKLFTNASTGIEYYGEMKWYEDSLIYCLPKEIEIEKPSSDGVPSMNDLIDYLKDKIGQMTYNKGQAWDAEVLDENKITLTENDLTEISKNYSLTYKQSSDETTYVIIYKLR